MNTANTANTMNAVHVGIGEYYVSHNSGDIIKTFALGSCVGVIVYDRVMHVAGMIHVALPDSTVNEKKGRDLPGYFVDTGMPCLLAALRRHRAVRENVWIKIVGGSNIMDDNQRFDIGKRNVLAIKKFLWKQQLGISAEDIGGDISRTVSVKVGSGEVIISSGGKQWEF